MSIDLATSLTAQLPAVGTAVAGAWGLADALVVGNPTGSADALQLDGQAVVVSFTGASTGELALIVDHEIAQQLMESPASPPDLIAALGPAVTAALLALGDISASASEVLDAGAATRRVLALEAAAGVTLTDDGEIRACIIIGTQAAAIPAPRAAASATPLIDEPPANRLDLLRGVQMQATVELGRTEITINDLLALRSGSVIELDRAAGAPADLYVNGRLIARGEVVVVDENYGLRILQVIADEPGR